MGIPHIAFDLRFGHQSGYGVYHHHVNGAGAYQSFGDLQSLFTGIRLGNIQIIHHNAQIFGINRIQSVFGIDKSGGTAQTLGLSHHMQGNGGFTGRFRPENLYNTAPGHSSYPQSQIQIQAAGRDHGDVHIGTGIPQLHDGAFTKLLFYLTQGDLQRFFLI